MTAHKARNGNRRTRNTSVGGRNGLPRGEKVPAFVWRVERGARRNYDSLGRWLSAANLSLYRHGTEGLGLLQVLPGGKTRLLLKAADFIPPPDVRRREGARFGVVTIGSCEPATLEALELLAREGVAADYMRIKGFPFSSEVEAFFDAHDLYFVVEQSRDAQLRSLLVLETGVAKSKLRPLLVYGGFPLSAKHVVDEITRYMEVTASAVDQ